MDKAYLPSEHEDSISEKWNVSGAFQPSQTGDPYVIAIPPPNVTGTLHAGHAMFLALQDILIRWRRMQGRAALWVPGTDHAAIATESVVLKNLGIRDRNKEISREDFLKECEKWTEQTHERITNQIQKMGASCDWSREAYTFDKTRNRAVNAIFTMFYNKELIYRGDRMVNWSVGAQSVLADDEVEWEDREGAFYSIRCGEFIMGTVRSETKCSHSPLFVNGSGQYARVRFTQSNGTKESFIFSKKLFDDVDRRKKTLNLLEKEGTKVELLEIMLGKDLVGREFEYETYAGVRKFVVMADDEVIDMEKGTGAMTISVCHSPDDYELAKKHGLDEYRFQKIDFEGNMTAISGPCEGLSVEEARKKSAEIMREKELLVGEDTHYSHRVPLCYRSGSVVEPMVSKQWFVAVEKEFTDDFSGEKTTLKKQMQEAVRGGHVKIVPQRFEKIYFHWIDNLRDWCISRQIWWGHRIPVWYHKLSNETYIGTEPPRGDEWTQDEDTLDTWFSSATWPFSVFGWPEKTADLERFYPTDVLETGHDILFFWVARMIMFGRFATGQYPFHTVYLHGLVCDAKGQKMSKSKGNGIDPLDMIKKFGTDALRLSLIMGTTPGNNANLGEEKISGCRNLCNKLWNISRFLLEQEKGVLPKTLETDLQKWIVAKRNTLIQNVTDDLENFRFGDAAQKLWEFTWDDLADWAIEAAKAEKNSGTPAVLCETLDILLRLWHPILPFITEKIREEMGGQLLISDSFPKAEETQDAGNFEIVKNAVSKIRSMRKNAGVDPTRKITAMLSGEEEDVAKRNADIISFLARLDQLRLGEETEEQGATDQVPGLRIFLPSSGMIDPKTEAQRVQKELEKAKKLLTGLEAKLKNPGYLKKAPKVLVEETKKMVEELRGKIEVLEKNM
ncbi:class I tRNA ligase family protein [Candidatus Peregrinibacteria bacterium]|nr:MAG: class I tRNA ligase family protein [Candidatus Peregrinibacteria bacterium]